MQTDLHAETASVDPRDETVPVGRDRPPEADGPVGGLATLAREDASDPDLPTAVELRAELLALQQHLDAIVGDGDRVPARIAADSVASERIAALAEQVRQFHNAVRERRRLVGWRSSWFRRLWSRRAGVQSGSGAVTAGEPAERAYRAREAQTGRQLFDAGLHHLR